MAPVRRKLDNGIEPGVSVGTGSRLLTFKYSNRQQSLRPPSTMGSEHAIIREIRNLITQDDDFQSKFDTIRSGWVEIGLDETTISRQWRAVALEMNDLFKNKIATVCETTLTDVRIHRVKKIRAEMVKWWDKCCYSDQQRSEFLPYYDDVFTDELLKAHQVEVTRLQRYHETNLHLFESIEHFLCVRETYLYLEAEAKNPNRLFENRGGQLLKNERELKLARKDLPRLERELHALTADFSARYGHDFTAHGHTLQQMLAANRVKVDKNIQEMTLQNTAELKSRVANGSCLKRKIAASTTKSNSKVHGIVKRPKPLI